MNERKNIDKLFQEKFKDFESKPSEKSWEIIELKLKEKKKKRKIIPFWWKLSGVAALFIMGLITANLVTNQMSNPVIEIDTNKNPENSNSKLKENTNSQNEIIIQNELTESNTDNSKESLTKSTLKNNQQQLTNSTNTNSNRISNQSIPLKNKISNFPKNTVFSSNQKIVSNTSNRNSIKKSPEKYNPEKNSYINKAEAKKEEVVLENKIKKTDSTITLNTENQSKSEYTFSIDQQNKSIETGTKKIDNIIEENQLKKLDSTAIATVVPNALEELLNEKENNLITKEPELNRWQITSNVAPIYFGSTSNGSPIDSTFINNSKDYNTNLSFGLGVNYALNKRFSIRTGINKVTLTYNTNDVIMFTAIEPNALNNVNISNLSQNIHIGNNPENASATPLNSSELRTNTFKSYINQTMGYVEIPLEVSYAVLNHKFGVNLIAGISTLFLNENKLLIISSDMVTNLGEANNLNKTHFSSNIGLGIKYAFFKQFQANFEPVFKYQLRTFSQNDGNFKPYFFGLYTGLSYSF